MTHHRTTTAARTFARAVAFALLLALAASAEPYETSASSSQIYDKFDGNFGNSESSSWFDPSKWMSMLSVPTSTDKVWIDEPGTYVAIDGVSTLESSLDASLASLGAECQELVIGRTYESHNTVQVDLMPDASLKISDRLVIGNLPDSSGLLYASTGSTISVLGDNDGNGGEGIAYVGGYDGQDGGKGTVVLAGTAKFVANDLKLLGSKSRLFMDTDSTLVIVPSSSNGKPIKNIIKSIEKKIKKEQIVHSPSTGAVSADSVVQNKRFVVKEGVYNENNNGLLVPAVFATIEDVPPPTSRPTMMPTITTAPTPDYNVGGNCKDTKFKALGKRDFCKWMSKKQNRIDEWCVRGAPEPKEGKGLARELCLVSCGICDPPPVPVCQDDLEDRSDFMKKNDPTKTCDWIASFEKTKDRKQKCSGYDQDLSIADYWCPKTCEEYRNCVTCDQDRPEFRKNDNPDKPCGWIATLDAKTREAKCLDTENELSVANYWCPVTCAEHNECPVVIAASAEQQSPSVILLEGRNSDENDEGHNIFTRQRKLLRGGVDAAANNNNTY